MITIEDTDQSSRSRRSSSSSQSRKESNIRRSAVPPPSVGAGGGRGRPEKAIYQPPRRESDRPTIEKMDAIRTVSQNVTPIRGSSSDPPAGRPVRDDLIERLVKQKN